MDTIRLEDLGFNYGDGWIFRHLSLTVPAGDFAAVIGANGVGKSTLLRMVARILAPTEGKVFLYGTEVSHFQDWGRLGYVPQNPARRQRSFPISVEEVVQLGRWDGRGLFHRFDRQDREAVEATLARFELRDLRHRKVGELSGGQQQRVFLARAMVNDPELLLLDEPATGIDADAKEALYRMLADLNGRGKTIVMVSHDLEMAARYAKTAICLDDGGLCFFGPIREGLHHRHKHGYFFGGSRIG